MQHVIAQFAQCIITKCTTGFGFTGLLKLTLRQSYSTWQYDVITASHQKSPRVEPCLGNRHIYYIQ